MKKLKWKNSFSLLAGITRPSAMLASTFKSAHGPIQESASPACIPCSQIAWAALLTGCPQHTVPVPQAGAVRRRIRITNFLYAAHKLISTLNPYSAWECPVARSVPEKRFRTSRKICSLREDDPAREAHRGNYDF